MYHPTFVIFFFFNDTATTEIYTLSLHDALPISASPNRVGSPPFRPKRRLRNCADRRFLPARPAPSSVRRRRSCARGFSRDRKSTRLNSSHSQISYAVFCLQKKNLTM